MPNELREKIAAALLNTDDPKKDETYREHKLRQADSIVSLLAPELEKARKWTEFSEAFENDCPICKARLIFPRNSYCYCEECGWPDEVRPSEEEEQTKEKARKWDRTLEWFRRYERGEAPYFAVLETIKALAKEPK
jgi:hypothetical protein